MRQDVGHKSQPSAVLEVDSCDDVVSWGVVGSIVLYFPWSPSIGL